MRRSVVGLAAGCAVAACVVATVMVGRRVRLRMKWRKVALVLEELEEACATPVQRLQKVSDAMAGEMHAGLASEGGSKLKMLLTYVDNLPIGSEKGTYYGLDLGDTTFRISRVQLIGQRSTAIKHDVQQHPIPQHLRSGTSEDLFNSIASSLKDFIEREGGNSEHLQHRRSLGFTFPFPVKQTSLSSGNLIKWTQGFEIEGMVNDTVATLALGYFNDEDTVAAVVFGKGTNACYVERADAIIKSQGLLTTSGNMVVNMEWGNFWSSYLPRTSYDSDMDANSPNLNDRGFEKMISGMYLGDIVRRVLLRMSQESDVFGPVSSKLAMPFLLRTPLILALHEDDSPELREVAKVLGEILELPDVSLRLRKLVVAVCDVVTRRAARLAAAGIVGILKKIGRDGSSGIASGKFRSGRSSRMKRTVVAIEGELYTSYSSFREYLNEAVVEILGEEVSSHVTISVTEDGSVLGAALIAAAASHSAARDMNVVQLL